MRKHHRIPTLALLAALSLAACKGDEAPASKAQGGDEDNQPAAYSPEEGQGTAVNDTTPHRPGSPAAP